MSAGGRRFQTEKHFRLEGHSNPLIFLVHRTARDSKPLEVIGTFNPIPQRPTGLSDEEARVAKLYKDVALDRSRAKYWLGVGAQPSEPVWKLLSMVRIFRFLQCMSCLRHVKRIVWRHTHIHICMLCST